VVVKEVVKVPCKYCGALIPIESQRCPNCGAKFTK
jgi:RNA polymerase subunit RPABC4/transcription elongation factor Spt4